MWLDPLFQFYLWDQSTVTIVWNTRETGVICSNIFKMDEKNYFNQVSGAASTWKLVETYNTLKAHCSFFCFSIFDSLFNWLGSNSAKSLGRILLWWCLHKSSKGSGYPAHYLALCFTIFPHSSCCKYNLFTLLVISSHHRQIGEHLWKSFAGFF